MTKVIGLKYSHDSGFAIVNEQGELEISIELERVNNNSRHYKPEQRKEIARSIENHGHLTSLPKFVIDGWDGSCIVRHGKKGWRIPTAPYSEFEITRGVGKGRNGVCEVVETYGDIFGAENGENGYATISYSSFNHLTDHIIGGYATSPWSETLQSCYCMVWDGGTGCRLYFVDPNAEEKIVFLKTITPLHGTIYGIMGVYWGPYKNLDVLKLSISDVAEDKFWGGMETPGKLMAYIAKGTDVSKIYSIFEHAYDKTMKSLEALYPGNLINMYRSSYMFEHAFLRLAHYEIEDAKSYLEPGEEDVFTDENILCTLHFFLQDLLVFGLNYLDEIASSKESVNFMFVGGCALNIKWNSAIRETGRFAKVWIPPFPNDAGSAIGAACSYRAIVQNEWHLKWNVYCGQDIIVDDYDKGSWSVCRDYDMRALAMLLYKKEVPIVFLHGRSEAGPRALGHRSILMSPKDLKAKQTLNRIKDREPFRPVAPICMEERASQWFNPGTPDKYMIFEHVALQDTIEDAPAVVHLDGTARLQTITKDDCPLVYELLSYFYEISGIPMLCNTSANEKGSGFFDRLSHALNWANRVDVDYVWCNFTLYCRS